MSWADLEEGWGHRTAHGYMGETAGEELCEPMPFSGGSRWKRESCRHRWASESCHLSLFPGFAKDEQRVKRQKTLPFCLGVPEGPGLAFAAVD